MLNGGHGEQPTPPSDEGDSSVASPTTKKREKSRRSMVVVKSKSKVKTNGSIKSPASQVPQKQARPPLSLISPISSTPLLSSPAMNQLHLEDTSPSVSLAEHNLHKVLLKQSKDTCLSNYIPPTAMAKANLQTRDNDLFLLMDKVQEFLKSKRQVMLILGDSGAGKSTFNKYLELELLGSYKSGDPFPLFINLPTIRNPEDDLIGKQLKAYGFHKTQILELKEHCQFILICDGYDESQLTTNLHTSNLFNRPGQWNVKMLISCRTQYLGHDYLGRFVPQGGNHYNRRTPDLFYEATIAPFSKDQIERYVEQYVPLEPRTWTTHDYMDKLTTIPNLLDLVKNPFLLTLALEALPEVTEGHKDLSAVFVTRVQLYDIFVVHWLDVNKRRLERSSLAAHERATLEQLLEADFVSMGIEFSMKLASAVFEKQDGNPVVQYVHLRDKESWQEEFFGPDPVIRMLRESSPLTRTGSQFRFLHRSIQEYFFSRIFFNPSTRCDNDEFSRQPIPSATDIQSLDVDSPFFKRSLLSEPAVIQFLCERVQKHASYKSQLLAIIQRSKTDAAAAIAATNAITILVRAGVTFNGANLRGVRIPGADLSGGQFDSAQFQGADLVGVNFARSWLRHVDLSNARLADVRFGELPYLERFAQVLTCVFSPDGTHLAVGLDSGVIDTYDIATWTINRSLYTHGHQLRALDIAFSPNGHQLVSGIGDNMLQLWDIHSSESLSLDGHTGSVTRIAFSPCGQRIASASSDSTVRLWDSKTCETVLVLVRHVKGVNGLAYSPDGKQLASGGEDGTIRFWDPATGKPGAVCECPYGAVRCLAYSPDGRTIATGHDEGEVQLWDCITRGFTLVLRGHTRGQSVTSVTFSPNSQWIASSCSDSTIRLWDASVGTCVSVLTGHRDAVRTVSFSPDGLHVASGGDDGKVRLWEVNASGSSFEQDRHNGAVFKVSYSPDGKWVSTGSKDMSIRRWDSLTGAPESAKLTQRGLIDAVEFSPDGCRIATAGYDNVIRSWSCLTGVNEAVWRGHQNTLLCLAYSPCGRWIASSSMDQTARIWNADGTGEGRTLADPSHGGFYCLAFSPCGSRLAVGSMSESMSITDTQSGLCLRTLQLSGLMVSALAYSPSGEQIAIGTWNSTIYIWDLAFGRPEIRLRFGHSTTVSCVAYSPCGEWIVSGGDDKTVRLWRRQAGSEERWELTNTVSGFFGGIHSVAWRPTGPLEFVTGCEDHSVRVWRVMSSPDEKDVHVAMLWGSNIGQLVVSGVIFEGASGLTNVNIQLLMQRGAKIDGLLTEESESNTEDKIRLSLKDNWRLSSLDGGGLSSDGLLSEREEDWDLEAAIAMSMEDQQREASIRYGANDGDDGVDEDYARDLEAAIRLSMKEW
ncbi:hypothetical protein BGZ89_006518 [Linnemannia elongata]|nr:hypothetical protein BGZ89_006518 [Linnemannia elongata]